MSNPRRVISVLGRKGGTGKSLISHLLARGVALCGGHATMMMTDVRTRKPSEHAQNRNYEMASPPTDESRFGEYLIQVLQRTEGREKGFFIIDGGANRRSYDLAVAFLSGIVLIPTGSGGEEMDVAEADYAELKRFIIKNQLNAEVFIVLNRWPGESRKRVVLENKPRIKEKIEYWEERGMLFPEIFTNMPSLVEIADDERPAYTLRIDAMARDFAKLVTGRLGVPLGDGESETEETSEESSLAAEIQGLASNPVKQEPEEGEGERQEEQAVKDQSAVVVEEPRPLSGAELLRRQLLDQLKVTSQSASPANAAKAPLRKTG